MEAGIYKMKYKKGKRTENLIVLGEEFVKNNGNKFRLIINNKKFSLINFTSFDNSEQNKIKMILSQYIYNISYMFKNCNLLESFSKLLNNDNDIFQNEKHNIDDGYNNQMTNNEENDLIDDSYNNKNIAL